MKRAVLHFLHKLHLLLERAMTANFHFGRRAFLEGLAAAGVGGLACGGAVAAETAQEKPASTACSAPAAPLMEMRQNMVGAYGPWLADTVLGTRPGGLSLRSDRFASVEAWRTAARKRTWECIAPVDLGGVPE